jgi:long-subunit acyl-CoA synthetase (AMP-forming)
VDETGNDVGPGQAGEALLKGPIITQGYHCNPEANAIAFTEDGWFRTGDVIRIEGDLLYVVGRRKVCRFLQNDGYLMNQLTITTGDYQVSWLSGSTCRT